MTSEEIKTNKYISLTEAAEKYTEYSQEYLSLRARQGKLKAVKIGRNWLTKKEWVEEYIAVFNGNGEVGGHALSDTKSSTEIIANSLRQKKSTATALKLFSLSELENYSGYSQEYLSLRARQGKLKAVKIGRNWLIAKEWIDEYKNNVDNKQKISQVFGAFLQQKIFSPAINLKNNFYSTLQLLKKQSAVLLAATILIFCSAGLVFGFPYINDLQQAAKKTALKSLQNVYEVSKEKANNDLSFFGEQLNTTTNDFTRFLGEQKFALQVIAQNEFQNFISSTSNFFQKEKQLVYADLVDTILATENIENYIEGKAGDFSRHDINKIIVSMAMVQKEFKEGVYQFFVHVSQVALDEAPKNYQVVNFLKKAPAIGKLFKQSFFVLQDVVRVEIKNRQYELERTFQESKLISDGWRVDVDFNKVKEVIVNEVYNQLSIFNDKNYVVSQALVFGEQEINKLFDQAAVDCQRFLAKARNDISLSFSAWIEQLNATGKIVLVTIDGLQANIENKVGNYWAAGQNNWQDNWRAVTAGVNQRGDQLANNIDNFSANLLENVQQGMAWLMIGSTNKADEFSLTFFQKIKFFTSLTSQSLRATSQIAWDSAQISGNAIGDKIVEGIGDAAGALRSLTYSIYNRTSEGLAKGYEFITMPWREKATQQLVKTAVVNAPVGQIIPTTTSAAEEMIAQLTPKELAPKEIISGIIEKGALSQNASINTIREIARIDESSLVLIRSQIAELQRNAAKAASVNDLEELRNLLTKIQATPPIYSIVSAAPAYIGSTGLQISGGTDFNTLGVSGLSGIRELSVGGSTTLGKTDSDFLTVNASAGFLADVTFNKDVDIAGDLTLNGLVFNTASGGAMVITSTSSPQLTVAYNSSHYFTTNVSSAGVSTLASVGVLNLTGNGISIKTDTTGDILLSSANNLFEKFATSSAYTLYQGETARLAINTAGDISLTGSTTITGNTVIVGNSTTTGNSVISGNLIVSGTSTLTVTSASQLVIAGNTYFSALTAGSVPFVGSGGLLSQNNSNLFWDSATARLGVGTTTPIAKLTVEGDTYFMGNATTTGNLFVGGSSVVFGASSSTNVIVNSAVASNLIPDQNALRNLGSAAYFWDNLYIDSIVANNMSVASTSIGGTNSNDFVINADNATADTETANLIFFRGTVVPNALLTWDSIADRFDFNQSILMQNDSSTTTVISLDVRGKAGQIADLFRVASSTETSFFNITSAGLVGIGTSTPTEKLEVAGNIKPETSLAYNLGTVSMDTTPDVTFNGLVQFDYLGYYNSLAHGDFNGDGYEDVLVSAKLAKGGGTQKGQAYIFYGGPTGPDNTADITFTGANNGDLLGTAVATGDVNGDGYMDAIVSAYAAAGGGSARGQIYVYYGGPAMDNVADVVINGSADGDQLARSLAVADVNGDGYQDIIAGAWGIDSGGVFNSGGVEIFYGGPNGPSNTANVILSATTPEVDGYFGDTVAAGDVNGDGYADVVVGSYHGNGGGIDSGQVFVFYGTATGLDNTADLTINGEVADDHFGSALSLAGDVNGDGYTDIIVGAPYKNSNAGKAYIYYGGASMNNTVDVVFSGAAAKDYLGESVAAAGDVNGDGFDDVIVGSPRNNQWSISNPECRAGQAHIYYGGASMDNTADISFTDYLGIDSDYLCLDYFGRSVMGDVDFNNDGYIDIMVGANGAFVGNENGHGQAYIYYGSGSRWKSVFAQNFNASRGMQIGSLTLDQYNLINNSFFGISTPNWEIDRTGNASFQSLISAGNVGIGTSTPYTKLDVYGSFQVGTSTTPTLTPLFIANTGTATVGIGTSTPSAKFAIAGVAGVNSLNIASTTGVSMLSLDQYGNLGVGKASASRRVEIFDAANPQLRLTQASGAKYSEFQTNSLGDLIIASNLGQLFKTDSNDYSVVVGQQSGANLVDTEGQFNTTLGWQSLYTATSSDYNTAIGFWSLYNNTSGERNTALGANVLYSNVSGSINVAVGDNALYRNTTGGNNIALGPNTLLWNQTGEANTVIGSSAGGANFGSVTGSSFSSSTIIGMKAGYNLGSGSKNVLIGYQAGDSLTTGASNIIIGYDQDALTAGTSNFLNIGGLIYGDLSLGNVAIGTSSPAARLDIVENRTGGTIINADYETATTLTADVLGMNLDLSTNVTPGAYNITGSKITLPSGGTGTNIFAQYLEGSSELYNFNAVSAQFNVPASFNAAGDVSLAYDLVMTNNSAGYIRFQGPGYVQTEDASGNYDLTLSGANAGNVVALEDASTTASIMGLEVDNFGINQTTDAINKYGLYIDTSTGDFTGSTGTSTVNYGLYVVQPTGADLNYAAVFAGGNVGIGTTSPFASLSIAGVAGTNAFQISSTTGATDFMVGQYGNVGIGTSSPSARLDLLGRAGWASLHIASSTGANMMSIDGYGLLSFGIPDNQAAAMTVAEGTNTYLTFDTTDGAEKIVAGKDFEVGTMKIDQDSGAVQFVNMNVTASSTVGTAESLAVALSGVSILTVYGEANGQGYLQNMRVGIGTTSPVAMLSIQGNASTSGGLLRITTSTTEALSIDALGYVGLGTTSPSARLAIAGIAGVNAFQIASTTGATDFMVGQYGNVGIGTSSPSARLDLLGRAGWASLHIASSTGANMMSIDGYGLLSFGIPDNQAAAMTVAEGTNTYLTFDTTDGAEKIVVGKNFEVGTMNVDADSGAVNFVNMDISTTTATSTAESLSVSLDGTSILTVYGEADGTGGLINHRVGIGTTSPIAMFEVRGNASTSGALLKISTSTTVAMYIDDAGKVSFGTTTPTAKLFIAGTAGTNAFQIASTTGATDFMVGQYGNVGIGTSSPSARLDLLGRAGWASLHIASSTGANMMSIDGYGLLSFGIPDNQAAAMTVAEGTNTYLTFDTTDGAEKMVVGKDLEVGLMNIDADSGSVQFANMNISTTTATSTVEKLSISLDQQSVLTVYGEADGQGNLVNMRVGVGTSSPVAMFEVAGNASTSGPLLRISTSTTEALSIDALGRVGMGTTTPATKLDIYGVGTQLRISTTSGYANFYVDNNGYLNMETQYSTTSALQITNSNIIVNQPMQFNSPGDVGLSYDLSMENPSAAYIRFAGAGYVQTESPFGNYNLVLSAANAGKVLINDDLQTTGQTNFVATTTQTLITTTAIQVGGATHIVIDATSSIVLGATPTIADGVTGDIIIIRNATSNSITLQDEDTLPGSNLQLGSTGRALTNGSTIGLMFDGTDWMELWYSGVSHADYAEMYKIKEDVGSGEVVSVNKDNYLQVQKAVLGDVDVAGIISASPAYLIGQEFRDEMQMPVALAGRVPVKISLEAGEIKKGDVLIPSTKPGYAMRYNEEYIKELGSFTKEPSSFQNIPIVGVALEDYGTTSIASEFLETTYKTYKVKFREGSDSAEINRLNGKYKVKIISSSEQTIEIRAEYVSGYFGSSLIETSQWLSDNIIRKPNPEFRPTENSDETVLCMVKTGYVKVGPASGLSKLTVVEKDGQLAFEPADKNFADSLDMAIEADGSLVVGKLKAKQAEIGSAEKPAGITLYDEETKQPYCLKMKAGAMISEAGKCSDGGVKGTEFLSPERNSVPSESQPPATSTDSLSLPSVDSATSTTSTEPAPETPPVE